MLIFCGYNSNVLFVQGGPEEVMRCCLALISCQNEKLQRWWQEGLFYSIFTDHLHVETQLELDVIQKCYSIFKPSDYCWPNQYMETNDIHTHWQNYPYRILMKYDFDNIFLLVKIFHKLNCYRFMIPTIRCYNYICLELFCFCLELKKKGWTLLFVQLDN